MKVLKDIEKVRKESSIQYLLYRLSIEQMKKDPQKWFKEIAKWSWESYNAEIKLLEKNPKLKSI